jgi:Mn2+/Fe2+ NRAMP family transporter
MAKHAAAHLGQEHTTPAKEAPDRGIARAVGLGVITGAADDDPSAIGTYASAGATFGSSFLWVAPFTFPLMFAVVYLSAKLGQVAGQGLFAVLRKHYSKWLLYPTLVAILIGNAIEAGADLGGIAAALKLLVPVPVGVLVPILAAIILGLQIWGSYTLMHFSHPRHGASGVHSGCDPCQARASAGDQRLADTDHPLR